MKYRIRDAQTRSSTQFSSSRAEIYLEDHNLWAELVEGIVSRHTTVGGGGKTHCKPKAMNWV